MPVNGDLPKVCKAAMAHFAWRKGCDELMQLHERTCLAAYLDIKEDHSKSVLKKLMQKRERQMYRLPSVRSQCDGLWQILQECTEEMGSVSKIPDSKINTCTS